MSEGLCESKPRQPRHSARHLQLMVLRRTPPVGQLRLAAQGGAEKNSGKQKTSLAGLCRGSASHVYHRDLTATPRGARNRSSLCPAPGLKETPALRAHNALCPEHHRRLLMRRLAPCKQLAAPALPYEQHAVPCRAVLPPAPGPSFCPCFPTCSSLHTCVCIQRWPRGAHGSRQRPPRGPEAEPVQGLGRALS